MSTISDHVHLAPSPRLTWRWWYLHRVTATLVRSFGYDAAIRLSSGLARGIFDLNPSVRTLIEHNLTKTGIVRDYRASVLAQQVFENIARFWIEVLYVPRRFRPRAVREHVEFQDADQWERLKQSRRPLVLLSPYLGNPVIGLLTLSQHFGGLTMAMDAVSRTLVDAVWPGAIRHGTFLPDPRLRVLTLPADRGRLEMAMEQKYPVCFLTGPRGGQTGRKANLLAQPVRLNAIPFRLAHRAQAGVAVWTCTRCEDPAQAFHLHLLACLEDAQCSLNQRFRAIVRHLERAIATWPSQYLWTRVS